MSAVRWVWSPGNYWPLWLGLFLGLFFLREIWALVSSRSTDTFSDWTWNQLHIMPHESFTQWNASDLLVFCAYVGVFVAWLPWHFFFRKFG